MRYVPREITARKEGFPEFSVGLLPCDHKIVRFLLFLLLYGTAINDTPCFIRVVCNKLTTV